MTVEEYFQNRNRKSQAFPEELFLGAVRPVPTPSKPQLILFANLAISLGKPLRATAFQIQTDQVRILHEASQSVKACGACINYGMPSYHPRDEQRSAFKNPVAVFDFPSSEVAAQTLIQEFQATFADLNSLLCYALILQNEKKILLQMRSSSSVDKWESWELNETHPKLPVPFGDAFLNLHEIYEGLNREGI